MDEEPKQVEQRFGASLNSYGISSRIRPEP